jgi:large subunit ribosomal protein LX
MSEVRVFRVTGEMVKPNLRTTFRKEIRALTPENAKEKVYTDLGSKHRAKRFQIRILKVEEIPPEDIENPLLRKLTLGDKPDVE